MKLGRTSLLITLCLALGSAAHAQGVTTAVSGIGEELARLAVWLLVAAILFAMSYRIVDIVIPGKLRDQLAEGNTALAVFAGSLFISAAIIIAALVH